MTKKILSVLVVVVMLLSGQGMSAVAGNAVEESGLEITGTAFPVNPVHHCTGETGGSDYTDWSYVYFGSYPQAEVKGSELTIAITGANYDANGDAWVNGTKYRRISKRDTRYDLYFGDSEYRYFKWQRIRWRVLQNNGRTLYVMADQALDCHNYHNSRETVTWNNCTLRTWLNGTFYNTAFSSREKSVIVKQTLVNDDNKDYGTEGGNNTQDNIYLLSGAEIIKPEYGFCSDYSVHSASRWIQPCDYAHAMGAYTYSNLDTNENENCIWWLRLPGYDSDLAASVLSLGFVSYYGDDVDTAYNAVVPALHINLSSGLWTDTDDGTSGAGGEGENTNNGDDEVKVSRIILKGTSLKGKPKSKEKAFTVKWKKESSVTGYQIQYSTSKKFSKKTTKTKTVKQVSKTNITIKKLKPDKKYYVRICTYKIVNGKSYYSDWSKVKSVKTKK